jgi:hypothetical protein
VTGWPGPDPISRYELAREAIAALQDDVAREATARTAGAHRTPGSRLRTTLGLWLIRFGNALAADREAVERAIGLSAAWRDQAREPHRSRVQPGAVRLRPGR